MLRIFPANADPEQPVSTSREAPILWIDLLNPSAEEVADVEKLTGGKLPSLGRLSEIERSSRLKKTRGTLYMSTPSTAKRPDGARITPPLGFVLSANRLVTLRYLDSKAFDRVAETFNDPDSAPQSASEVFISLCEAIVDRVSEALEELAAYLTGLSTDAFNEEDTKGRYPARAGRLLRIQLKQVGRLGNRLSEMRDGLQGLARVIAFADSDIGNWSEGHFNQRLVELRQDLHSLTDYEEQLANKVQFVLDALVGLIGISQNDIFKVLTIVSIVGIPPTLMAGIYGMNFHNMPELGWAWGYEFGWAMIILSGIIPLIWFKIRGWF